MGRVYNYRCTTDKLTHHLNSIQDAGDEFLQAEYMGGRDWMLFFRAASTEDPKSVSKPVTGNHVHYHNKVAS